MNLPKPSLLLVDDEERILRSLAMLFRGQYQVHATTDPHEAIALVQRAPVHVVVSDQKMPVMRGAELLRQVRERSPNTMRILLTGYSELEAVVASVNEGEIFRYVNKPWDAAELRSTVDQAAQIALGLFAAPAGAAEAAPAAAPTAGEGILVIDDDREVFEVVQEIVGASQPVHWAQSLEQAFERLEREAVGVIVSELTVRGESLTAALKLLKAHHPEVVTIVATPFQDTSVLIDLINQGQIYRFITKPIVDNTLKIMVNSALRQHGRLAQTPQLHRRYEVAPAPEPPPASAGGRLLERIRSLRSWVTRRP